ncbi:MAG: DEAD/DEAH box helicase [Anaeroplasmataceae bacterium]|nr:DEAD/DEAH box helicase [Anaeroplasmataceae bacterium]
MNKILENGNIIKKIRDGENLDEIMSYARDSLYKQGPTDTIVLEILSYIKIFHGDYFAQYENDIVETMGLYFKNPVPKSLKGLIFDLYNQHIQEKWGSKYTPVQANILQRIDDNNCFSFSAPTSTGKSFVFRHIITNSTKDIVVVVPSRALINEYYEQISKLLNMKEVNVLSFVDQINTKHAKRNVFILTPERARELFKNRQWINLEYILFDEAQLSDEKSTRGLYFDSIVRRALRAFPTAKFIFSHPFISNPAAQLKKNLSDINENMYAIQYKQKSVGQIFYVHDGTDYFHLGTNKAILGKTKLKATFDPIEKILNDGGSILIYVAKSHILKKSVYQDFAKYISMCSKIQNPDALKMIEDLREYLGAAKGDSDFYNSDMISKLEHGVVMHHGSMPLSARLILEHFTQKGFCRICFATSTLEQGINMPFDAVYIDRFEASKSLSVKNLIGRAGRSTLINKFDIGIVVIHDSAKTAFRNVIVKEEPISEVSHLDKKDENIDEKYDEFKKAIKEGTFNDEYNLTQADVEKLKTDQIITRIPELLDMMFDEKNKLIDGNENIKEVREVFHNLYASYLGRMPTVAEKAILSHAIKIMLWKVSGRTFRNICQYRYAYAAAVNERRKNPDKENSIHAKYLAGYDDIPNKKLSQYPLFDTKILAKDVDYDLIIYDTYDYLDKLIGFKLSDIFYAIFYEYYVKSKDERSLELAKYIKYGTISDEEIWMLRYGFDFEDIEWLKPCITSIDEKEIIFSDKVDLLSKEQLMRIDRYRA